MVNNPFLYKKQEKQYQHAYSIQLVSRLNNEEKRTYAMID